MCVLFKLEEKKMKEWNKLFANTYFAPVVPFGIDIVINYMSTKLLGTHCNDCIGI